MSVYEPPREQQGAAMAGRLVTIATFEQLAEAHIAKNALDGVGIAAALNNEETSSLFGSATTVLGGIRLVVKEEDEAAAVKVLDDTFGDQEAVNEADLAVLAETSPAEDPVDAGQQPAPPADPLADSLAREKDARTALTAALLGYFLPFASLFAIVMIISAASGPGKLTRRGRYYVIAAVAQVILVPVAIALVWLYLVR